MHLIIDGYNLIRQSSELSQLDARDLEAGREALLRRLGAYRQSRPGYTVTVVFDGWRGGELRESRELHQGITVIYSRRGERADEVIKRLLDRERGRAVMVSSDRELQDFAQRVGAVWVGAVEFEHLCCRAGNGDALEKEENGPPPRGAVKKGPSRRSSKRQRQRQQRLRKL